MSGSPPGPQTKGAAAAPSALPCMNQPLAHRSTDDNNNDDNDDDEERLTRRVSIANRRIAGCATTDRMTTSRRCLINFVPLRHPTLTAFVFTVYTNAD